MCRTDGIGLFTALILIITMVFESTFFCSSLIPYDDNDPDTSILVWIAVIVRKNWRDIRRAGSGGGVALDLIFRVFLFGIYIIFGTV